MPKIMVAPNNFADIDKVINSADAIVIGIENLSVNFIYVRITVFAGMYFPFCMFFFSVHSSSD